MLGRVGRSVSQIDPHVDLAKKSQECDRAKIEKRSYILREGNNGSTLHFSQGSRDSLSYLIDSEAMLRPPKTPLTYPREHGAIL